jgi:hypothetical protein
MAGSGNYVVEAELLSCSLRLILLKYDSISAKAIRKTIAWYSHPDDRKSRAIHMTQNFAQGGYFLQYKATFRLDCGIPC